MSGNVIIFAAFIMLLGSCIGTQFGISVTRYARGISIRYLLGISMLICAIVAMPKLSGLMLGVNWFDLGSMAVTFCGLGLVIAMTERRDKRGHFIKGNVPWNKSVDNSQNRIIFTCQFCGKSKPVEDLEVLTRFSPPLSACRDCWKLLS